MLWFALFGFTSTLAWRKRQRASKQGNNCVHVCAHTHVHEGFWRHACEYAPDQSLLLKVTTEQAGEGPQPSDWDRDMSQCPHLCFFIKRPIHCVALDESLRSDFTPMFLQWGTGRKSSKRRHLRRSKPAGSDLKGKNTQCPCGREQSFVASFALYLGK